MSDPSPVPPLAVPPFTILPLSIPVERTSATPIADQIFTAIRQAILDGRLQSGARLPSGRDLAAQLGVARGTVRAAYERLIDEDLIFSAGAAGTRVVARPGAPAPEPVRIPFEHPLAAFVEAASGRPLPFQMGVPSYDAFPAKVWAKVRTRAVRQDALAYTSYPDPRGEPALRAQIASQIAISRHIRCVPDQIIVTGGYRHGLGLVLRALDVHGRSAWIEEPGYPIGRRALELAGMSVAPIAVDAEGLRVGDGIARAPDALLTLVTPGQQAPLGVTMSAARRRALLDWAEAGGGWIVEDDYLSELQLEGRAAPALASIGGGGGGGGARRVVHLGSFSKTLSPALGLGFVVAPVDLLDRMVEVAAVMAPAPNRTTQLAVAEFMADGHYLRHLRQMKALYAERRDLLRRRLAPLVVEPGMAGMAMLLGLPAWIDDVGLAARALERGIRPSALSPWYAGGSQARKGLLLGVTNLQDGTVNAACDSLRRLIEENGCRGT